MSLSTTHDPVNHPEHYTSSEAKCECCGKHIECIDITQHMNFCLGNAFKYIWRAGRKGNFAQDIRKAVWYLQKELDRKIPETQEPEIAPEEIRAFDPEQGIPNV